MVHEVHRVLQAELAPLHDRLRKRPPDAAQYRGREDDEETEQVELCIKIQGEEKLDSYEFCSSFITPYSTYIQATRVRWKLWVSYSDGGIVA